MNKKGLLFAISGPSGSGKGTIVRNLARDENIFISISATTRKPREGEKHGEHYFFISEKEFKELLSKGEILEHNYYCGNYYGTPKKEVYEQLDKGHDVILEIDVNGTLQVMENNRVVSIFIVPPSWDSLNQRLHGRGTESEDVIKNRMREAIAELEHASEYDYIVVNDTVEKAVEEVKAIMTGEKHRTVNMIEYIKGVMNNDEQTFS